MRRAQVHLTISKIEADTDGRTQRHPAPNAGKGRPKGSLNSTTRDVREAIAVFAQENVHKLQQWLDAVAEDDPARAADLYIRVIEYHVPKLARSEMSGPDGGPIPLPLARIERVIVTPEGQVLSRSNDGVQTGAVG